MRVYVSYMPYVIYACQLVTASTEINHRTICRVNECKQTSGADDPRIIAQLATDSKFSRQKPKNVKRSSSNPGQHSKICFMFCLTAWQTAAESMVTRSVVIMLTGKICNRHSPLASFDRSRWTGNATGAVIRKIAYSDSSFMSYPLKHGFSLSHVT